MLAVGLWFIIMWNAWNIFAAIVTGSLKSKTNPAEGCAFIFVQLASSIICIVAAGFALSAV